MGLKQSMQVVSMFRAKMPHMCVKEVYLLIYRERRIGEPGIGFQLRENFFPGGLQ